LLVNDIYDYASTRGMRLNSKKCKEMIINFLQYRLPFQDALQVVGNEIERVSSYKLLGVYLNNDLSWNLHCDYFTKKANKRLYILRILRRARIGYSTTCNSILQLSQTDPRIRCPCLVCYSGLLKS
jgi:hypothetical protein